jgi:flagellar hook-associated protein 2
MAGISLSGMASGMDTNSIVDQLMAIERNKIVKQNLRTKAIEAQATGLRDVQTKLRALKGAAEALRSPVLWANTQTVESSDAARFVVERTGMAPAGAHSFAVRQLAAAEQEGFTYTASATPGSLTVGGKTVAIPANAKPSDLAAAINANAELPVYATALDDDTIVFSSRQTGSTGAFDVVSDQLTADPAQTRAARDAEYSVDGGATWKSSASNVISDAVVGLKITAKGITAASESINVGVAGVNTAEVKDKLKAFVTAYNDVVTTTRAKLDEKGVRDPQTAADAAKGRLFGDTGLTGVLSRLRTTMSDAVAGVADGTMDELHELGISTGKGSGGASTADARMGKLVVDDARLDAALANPTRVRELFGAGSSPGFAQKIEKVLDDEAGTSGVLAERLKVNSAEQKRVKDRITTIEQRITVQEKRLRDQFTAMEKALSLSQSQGSWLMGQISSMQSQG